MQEAAATQTLARQVQAVGEASPRLAGLGKKLEKPSKNGDLSAKYEDLAGRDQDLLGRNWGI